MIFPKSIDIFIKKLLLKFGYVNLKEKDPLSLARRAKLFKSQKVNLIIDVGANVGQYGLESRDLGYEGRIVSFEPMFKEYKILDGESKRHPPWETFNFGIGDSQGEKTINISQNSISSSILNISEDLLANAPSTKYISQQKIMIKSLDECSHAFYNGEQNIWLKIDVQGYEKSVLNGAKELLGKIKIIQIELSLLELYKSQPTLNEMINLLDILGFALIGLEPGLQQGKSGVLLQIDGIFINKKFQKTSSVPHADI